MGEQVQEETEGAESEVPGWEEAARLEGEMQEFVQETWRGLLVRKKDAAGVGKKLAAEAERV